MATSGTSPNAASMVATEGTFYLQYRAVGRDSKKITRAIGSHPRDAKAALATQISVLNLRQEGMEVDDAPQLQVYRPISGPKISDVVSDYIATHR
jgi:hypothetical protein